MATENHKLCTRLHQTKPLIPAITDTQPDQEAPWQQLMMLIYVLNEVIEAMEREKATSHHHPLHQSWQNFVYQLRIKKPKLGTCLDNWLQEGFLAEQESAQ